MANTSLFLLAEETKREFLSKAIGEAITWIPVPALKLNNPGSAGTFYVSSASIGVAAKAFITMRSEPIETMEILKDKPSWSSYCRNMTVIDTYQVNNGGKIEFVYTQYYASTTMACARDFWTLRYTSVLDDGSYVVCEKSISDRDVSPTSPTSLESVKGNKLASGFMICPIEGGSIIYMVEHLDMEASNVPVLIRPLYESSELVAKQMIAAALHYVEHISNEKSGNVEDCRLQPELLRTHSEKVHRSFNDAVNGFREDGWITLNADGTDDLIMSIKAVNIPKATGPAYDSVLCIKSGFLLENVIPVNMTRALKERLSSWIDFDFSDHSESYSTAVCFAYPSKCSHNFSEKPMMFGYTNHKNEAFEVMRYRGILDRLPSVSSTEIYHMLMINGMEDTGFGLSSDLLFSAPDRKLPAESFLLTFGFRVILLGSIPGTDPSVNLAQEGTSYAMSEVANYGLPPALMTVAFQFPYEGDCHEDLIDMAQSYVRHVISNVKSIAMEIMLAGAQHDSNPAIANPNETAVSPASTFAENLAALICRSYKLTTSLDLLWVNPPATLLQALYRHPFSIICFTFSSIPVCIYANLQALMMLETTTNNMQMVTVDNLLGAFNEDDKLYTLLPQIMQRGYVVLSPGFGKTAANRRFRYRKGVVWQVRGYDNSIHCLAMAFYQWALA
ncbi:homeobox-leucine zipper protein REVOLUTA-like [Andrographis paniculata]|uniref:homeobox-leucine zipper protein REVOLUTA-like n=1 Tax=Andrographis paniculata TaxID=175694 RepID=UPI0021E8F936|nr:homeobox-leucine zipper protein REVOLUTA-like [Andrographis paniculata]